ncbi:MAG: hypothetical protein JO013_16340 [Alphaproteobacteria bacterium]|nr:hypothetical protein [Alphaproteobacteria bacterium]
MRRTSWTLAAAAAVSMVGTAAAEPRQVQFAGCVYRGTEGGCLMVRSGTRVYDISTAKPRPNVGRAIAGSGWTFAGPTTCMEGTRLVKIRWHYTRRLCPLRKPEAS